MGRRGKGYLFFAFYESCKWGLQITYVDRLYAQKYGIFNEKASHKVLGCCNCCTLLCEVEAPST